MVLKLFLLYASFSHSLKKDDMGLENMNSNLIPHPVITSHIFCPIQ